MIEVNNVSFSYRASTPEVLGDISFSLNKNEIISILGPSGCGKSTLLRCIGGLLIPKKGRITINGSSPIVIQRQKKIGFAFQDACLLEWLNVEDNIRLSDKIGMSIHDKNTSEAQLKYLLNLIGLTRSKNLFPSELSGGMKQRVSFARALYSSPDLLLLDEPFSSLDLLTKTKLIGEFSTILNELNTPTIIVTHHIEEAVMLSDRIIILSPRPAKIIKEINVNINKPRDYKIIENKVLRNIVSDCREILLTNILI